MPGGCCHSSYPSDFVAGLGLLFSPNRVADEQQMVIVISPVIWAGFVLLHRYLSSTWLTAEASSKRMIKAGIGMKLSFLLVSFLLPAVPQVIGRAWSLWNRSCWKWILLKQTGFCSVLTQASSPNSWAICAEKALCVCVQVCVGFLFWFLFLGFFWLFVCLSFSVGRLVGWFLLLLFFSRGFQSDSICGSENHFLKDSVLCRGSLLSALC